MTGWFASAARQFLRIDRHNFPTAPSAYKNFRDSSEHGIQGLRVLGNRSVESVVTIKTVQPFEAHCWKIEPNHLAETLTIYGSAK